MTAHYGAARDFWSKVTAFAKQRGYEPAALAIAWAARVVLPTESVVLISTSSLKTSRASGSPATPEHEVLPEQTHIGYEEAGAEQCERAHTPGMHQCYVAGDRGTE